jgi:anti-sigma B factor antagonist
MPDVSYLAEMITGVPVVTPPAEIDLTTADQFQLVLLEAAAHGNPTVVVDMTDTRFCDSAGLSVLARAHKRALEKGGELRLVIPAGGAVFRVFTLTSLDRFIPRFGSLQEALVQRPAAAPIPPARLRPSPGLSSPARRSGSRASESGRSGRPGAIL